MSVVSVVNQDKNTNFFRDQNKNDLILSYNKNDFYYNTGETPTQDNCVKLNPYDKIWKTNCDTQHFTDNSFNCLAKELCINRDLYNEINNSQNKLNGSNENYENVKEQYNRELINKYNLGFGIIGLFGFIFFTYR